MKELLALIILLFAIRISAQKPAVTPKKTLPTATAASKGITGKIAQFVAKESGYTKFAENVWSIPFNGNSLARFEVIVS